MKYTVKRLLYAIGILHSDRSLNVRLFGGWLSLTWHRDGKCKDCGKKEPFGGTQCESCWKSSPEYQNWLKEYGAFIA
jgi:hypothetical protein